MRNRIWLVPALLIASLLALHTPTAAQANEVIQVTLNLSEAGTLALPGATGSATLNRQEGWVIFRATLPEGIRLPEKSVLEGWIVDDGALQSERSNASGSDSPQGFPFSNRTIGAMLEGLPYSLSAGALIDQGDGQFQAVMRWPAYNFGPFDWVIITLETDGNETPWDPRPGSLVMSALIESGTPSQEAADVEALHGALPDVSTGQGVRLTLTQQGQALGLGNASGRALVLIEGAAATIQVQGITVPEGMVLEAFVADGGTLGNFGPSNAHGADNALGPAFNSVSLSAMIDAVPFATSLGVLQADDNGVYRLEGHWQRYAFRVYDVLMITLEADGNRAPWDPRPGVPVLVGAITRNTDPTALLAEPKP